MLDDVTPRCFAEHLTATALSAINAPFCSFFRNSLVINVIGFYVGVISHIMSSAPTPCISAQRSWPALRQIPIAFCSLPFASTSSLPAPLNYSLPLLVILILSLPFCSTLWLTLKNCFKFPILIGVMLLSLSELSTFETAKHLI
jgi:hypothetical protein